jgi:hypothetical protein
MQCICFNAALQTLIVNDVVLCHVLVCHRVLFNQPKDTLLSINHNVLDAGEASINTAVSLIRKSGGAPVEVWIALQSTSILHSECCAIVSNDRHQCSTACTEC